MVDPTPSNRLPLWRVMELASEDAQAAYYPFASSNRVLAAEIRAVRDYIRHHIPGNGWHTWQIRQLMDLLNDEADRAERGNG